jgi:hypothetical protein
MDKLELGDGLYVEVADAHVEGAYIGIVEYPSGALEVHLPPRKVELLAEFLEDHVREVYLAGDVEEDYE